MAALRSELYVTLAMITCSATCSILATMLTATGHDGVLGDTRARASSLADARRHSSIHSGDVSSGSQQQTCLVVYEPSLAPMGCPSGLVGNLVIW